jgi:hypothetical protein
VQCAVETDLLEALRDERLDDAGDHPADRQDDDEAEQVRQEAEERVERPLNGVADFDSRECG